MIITLHGTGAGIPNKHRLASCATLLFDDGSRVVLDAGEGASRAMVRDDVDLDSITAVAISHTHADHWAGLPGLVTAWTAFEREPDVDLYLPPGTQKFFEQALEYSLQFASRRSYKIRMHELQAFDLPDGWQLDVFETTHLDKYQDAAREHGITARAYGYVLANGDHRVVFSADIGSVDDLRGTIDGARLLICECSHVKPEDVLLLAADSGVEQVVFTHVADQMTFPTGFDEIPWSTAHDNYELVITNYE